MQKEEPATTPVMKDEQPPAVIMEDEEELARVYHEDQADRMPKDGAAIDWDVVGPRDAARLARVKKLYTGGAIQKGMDCYYAAMILQHSHKTDDYLLAHELCVVAIIKGIEQAKWLAAASEDRYLLSIGRLQRFGTQYRCDGPGGTSRLSETDTTLSDSTRTAFNTPSLAAAQARADQMNAQLEETGP